MNGDTTPIPSRASSAALATAIPASLPLARRHSPRTALAPGAPVTDRIACLVRDPVMRGRLVDAARGRAALAFARDVEELRAHALAGSRAVVVEVAEPDGAAVAATVRALRERHPRLTIIAYCGARRLDEVALVRIVRAGVTRLVIRDVHDAPTALRAALASAVGDSSGDAASRALRDVVPHAARPIVELCLARTPDALTVAAIARTLGVTRKTIASRLRAARLPTARELIAWGRLIRAAHLLEQPGVRTREAALDAGFPSDVAMHNAARRRLGASMREIARRGGFALALERLRVALRASRDRHAPRPPRATAVTRGHAG